MKIDVFIVTIVLSSLIACQNSESLTETPLVNPTHTSTPEKIKINKDINTKCTYLEKQVNDMSDALILLSPTAYYPTDSAYILSIPSMKRTELPLSIAGYTVFKISRTGDRVAYHTGETRDDARLVVSDRNGNIQKEVGGSAWIGIIMWLDEENIVLSKFPDSPEGHYIPVIYNLSSDQETKIDLDLPDISYGNTPGWYAAFNTNISFDPSIKYAIYRKSSGYSLYDLETDQTVVNIKGSSFSSFPQWRYDGQNAIFDINSAQLGEPLNEDIYEIKINGEANRLTYLGDIYPEIEVEEYSYSANGARIAFWYHIPQFESTNHLAILDMNTGLVTDTCFSSPWTVFNFPVWINDHELLFDQVDEEGNFYTIALDIQDQAFYRISPNVFPEGVLKIQ